MTEIAIWSPIDDDNNSAPPAGWPEGQATSSVNNCARAMMGGTRRWYARANVYGTYGGTANDISLTYDTPELPADGDVFVLNPIATNTGPVTLNVNGAGAKPLYRGDSPLRGGELQHFVMQHVAWSATLNRFLLMNAGGVPVLPLISAGGTANALSLTYASGGPTALVAGDRFTVGLSVTNTGPATLTVQGIGPNAIVAGGGPLTGGEMRASQVVDFVWDGIHFQLLDPALTGAFMPLGGGTFTGPIQAPGITSTSTITAIGAITSGGTVTGATVNSNGALGVAGSGSIAGSLAVTGTVNAATVGATGTVSGNLVTANNISSNNNVNAILYQLRSGSFASMDAGATQTVIYDPSTAAAITLYASGTSYYDNNSHFIRNRAASTTYARLDASGVYNAANTTTWNTVSDRALKEDVQPYNRGLDALLALQPVSYRFTAGTPFDPGVTRYGLVAQDVAAVVPEMVGETMLGEERVSTLDAGTIIWVLTNAVKELAARIEALEATTQE